MGQARTRDIFIKLKHLAFISKAQSIEHRAQTRNKVLICLKTVIFILIFVLSSSAETINYVYDDLNRLIRIEYPDRGSAVDYAYDEVGNRLEIFPDRDGDWMPDAWEVAYDLYPDVNDAGDDKDHDGLLNLQEYQAGSDPTKPDTDGDGILDVADNCPRNSVIQIGSASYSTLQAAYNTAVSGDIIKVHAETLFQNLVAGQNKSITLDGGYDCNFQNYVTETVLRGEITNSLSSLTLRTFYVRNLASPVDCAHPTVQIAGMFYPDPQSAYDAAREGDILLSRAALFLGDLNINQNKSVTFKSGYDCNYASAAGETRIKGQMDISNGTLTIESGTLIIE